MSEFRINQGDQHWAAYGTHNAAPLYTHLDEAYFTHGDLAGRADTVREALAQEPYEQKTRVGYTREYDEDSPLLLISLYPTSQTCMLRLPLFKMHPVPCLQPVYEPCLPQDTVNN